MSGTADADEYYRAIEEEFNRRRGAALLLSPRDWALIGEWRAAEVPLRVALQGIANVFEAFGRRAPTARRINSLAYCRQEVLALHELYVGLGGAAAGRPSPGAPADPARLILRHLGRLARRVREAMAACSEARLDPLVGALAEVGAKLKQARRETRSGALEPQGLEDFLRRLDGRLLDAAGRALPPDALREIEAACGRALREQRDRMSSGAFADTRRALMGKLLRQRCFLPRLTLFD